MCAIVFGKFAIVYQISASSYPCKQKFSCFLALAPNDQRYHFLAKVCTERERRVSSDTITMAYEEQDKVYSSLLESGEEEDVSGSEECNFASSGLGQATDEIRSSSAASKVDLEGEEESEDQDSEYESVVEKFKVKSKKRCKGRKSTWPEQHVNDMINVICSNDNLARKLIFQNTKNTRNGDLFKKVVEDSKKACQERDETFEFDVKQARTKIELCIIMQNSCYDSQDSNRDSTLPR